VAAPLKGRNPPGDERANEVIRCGKFVFAHLADELIYLDGFNMGITRVIGPVVFRRCSSHVRRKVDEVLSVGVLNIEKGFLQITS
jgi:hypothetical protein